MESYSERADRAVRRWSCSSGACSIGRSPPCSIVDMREEYAADGPGRRSSAARCATALDERLERREQALVLLNRRGFATAVFCRQCGAHARLSELQRLADRAHGAARPRARCHYCNYSMRVPKACPHCAGPYLEQVGLRHRARRSRGRERVSRRRASRASIATRSGDAARSPRCCRGSRARRDRRARRHADDRQGARLSARHAGRRDLGRRRPRPRRLPRRRADVSAADAGGRPRRPRRAAAARRSSRRSIPTHYSIQLACRQDYPAFFERGARNSGEAMRYPPAVALVNAVVQGRTLRRRRWRTRPTSSQRLRRGGERIPRARPGAGAARQAARRAPRAVLLKGTQSRRRCARRCARRSTADPRSRRRTIVDVDPLSVL